MSIARQCQPTLAFVHLPYPTDSTDASDEIPILDALNKLKDRGVVTVVADTARTGRWDERGVTPAFCRGDLAFHASSPEIEKQLVDWAERG
eukprot:10606408-Lingulodinium_polyedra.AAC.1